MIKTIDSIEVLKIQKKYPIEQVFERVDTIINLKEKLLPILKDFYYDEFILTKDINFIENSLLRVSFYFPEYKRSKISLSGNHVSVNQMNEALVEWMYLVVWFFLLQDKEAVSKSIWSKEVSFDFNTFVNEMWSAIYRRDVRKFSQMLQTKNTYQLDFFIKEFKRKKHILSVTIWYSWFVNGETECIIQLNS